MVDLGEDGRSMSMDCFGHCEVARNDIAMESVDQFLVGPVGRMCRVFLGDDQARATGCLLITAARRLRRVVFTGCAAGIDRTEAPP